jgi:hypothetical protein
MRRRADEASNDQAAVALEERASEIERGPEAMASGRGLGVQREELVEAVYKI